MVGEAEAGVRRIMAEAPAGGFNSLHRANDRRQLRRPGVGKHRLGGAAFVNQPLVHEHALASFLLGRSAPDGAWTLYRRAGSVYGDITCSDAPCVNP